MHGDPNATGDRQCQWGNLMPEFREQTAVPERATPCSEPLKETTAEERNKRGGGWREELERERDLLVLNCSSSSTLNGGFGGKEELIINLP